MFLFQQLHVMGIIFKIPILLGLQNICTEHGQFLMLQIPNELHQRR